MVLGLMIPLQCLAANVDVSVNPNETTMLTAIATPPRRRPLRAPIVTNAIRPGHKR